MSAADIAIRHAILRDCKLNANGVEFTVDEEGRLHPDPSEETAGMLLQLANYFRVEPAPAPASEPAPAPKPKAKRKPRKRRAPAEPSGD